MARPVDNTLDQCQYSVDSMSVIKWGRTSDGRPSRHYRVQLFTTGRVNDLCTGRHSYTRTHTTLSSHSAKYCGYTVRPRAKITIDSL